MLTIRGSQIGGKRSPLVQCLRQVISHRIHVWYIYIYGNIYHQYTPNVSICTIHGNKPRIRNLPRIRNKESETKSRESETKIRESETKIPRIRNQKSRESETKMRESETKIRESETENQKLKTANQKLKSRESETKLPRIRNQNPANQKPKTANQKPKPENQKLKNTREQVRFDWGNRQTVTLGLFRHSWVNHILNKQLLNTCDSMKAATLSTSTSLLKKSNPPSSSGHYVE